MAAAEVRLSTPSFLKVCTKMMLKFQFIAVQSRPIRFDFRDFQQAFD